MTTLPSAKRAMFFFDGQNLFHAAKYAFGYTWPNYDPLKLAKTICKEHDWDLTAVRFYTGLPTVQDDPKWNHFWTSKLANMGRQGVKTFTRHLKYRNQTVPLPDGAKTTVRVANEKGIDVRLALDVVANARKVAYDVGIIFSQDQDLSEVADEIRAIAHDQDRWIKLACAYPISPTYNNKRGINKTDWIKINRKTYDACLDNKDYRKKINV